MELITFSSVIWPPLTVEFGWIITNVLSLQSLDYSFFEKEMELSILVNT